MQEVYEVQFHTPPCGIGQHLYGTIDGRCIEAEVYDIICHAEAENYGYFLQEKVIAHQADGTIHEIDFSEVGRTWFLSYDELYRKLLKIKNVRRKLT